MLHVQHGDAFRHQMPQMRVIPGSRRVSIDDKLVLLLFELRLHVGRRCDEWRYPPGRMARRIERTSTPSRVTLRDSRLHLVEGSRRVRDMLRCPPPEPPDGSSMRAARMEPVEGATFCHGWTVMWRSRRTPRTLEDLADLIETNQSQGLGLGLPTLSRAPLPLARRSRALISPRRGFEMRSNLLRALASPACCGARYAPSPIPQVDRR